MRINEDFIENIELDTNKEVEPSDNVVCKYGFAFSDRIREPNYKVLEDKINKLMGKMASIDEYYFELPLKNSDVGPSKYLDHRYDVVVMFNGELKSCELYSLVESLLKIGHPFYQLLVCIYCDYMPDDISELYYNNFSIKISDTIKGIMDMLNGTSHKNNWIYNYRKNIPNIMIHKMFWMTNNEPNKLSYYYVYHYRVPERLALSISYNGFDSSSVDCSVLNGLPLADQEPLGWQRYLRVDYDDIETCIYNDDSNGI